MRHHEGCIQHRGVTGGFRRVEEGSWYFLWKLWHTESNNEAKRFPDMGGWCFEQGAAKRHIRTLWLMIFFTISSPYLFLTSPSFVWRSPAHAPKPSPPPPRASFIPTFFSFFSLLFSRKSLKGAMAEPLESPKEKAPKPERLSFFFCPRILYYRVRGFWWSNWNSKPGGVSEGGWGSTPATTIFRKYKYKRIEWLFSF